MADVGTKLGGTLRSRGVFVPNQDTLLLLRSRETDPDVHSGSEEPEGSDRPLLVLRKGYARSVRRWVVEIVALIIIVVAALALGGCMDAALSDKLIDACIKNGGAPILNGMTHKYEKCTFPSLVIHEKP